MQRYVLPLIYAVVIMAQGSYLNNQFPEIKIEIESTENKYDRQFYMPVNPIPVKPDETIVFQCSSQTAHRILSSTFNSEVNYNLK